MVSIKQFLLRSTLISSVVIVLILLSISFFSARYFLIDRAKNQLEVVNMQKSASLKLFFQNHKNLLTHLSHNPYILEAMQQYTAAYDSGVSSQAYRGVNEKYHPYLKNVMDEFGYYDVFLTNLEGDLIYTVMHEPDFNTNLIRGPYSDQNIARAFQSGKKGYNLVDFEKYRPSNDEPASFISIPVKDEDAILLGVMMAQIPQDGIDALVNTEYGMGETGQSYLIGSDKLMRSQSRFETDNTVLSRKIDTQAADRAIGQEKGVAFIDNFEGIRVLSAFEPLQVDGVNYYIISEIHSSEILNAVYQLAFLILIFTLAILVLIYFYYLWFANRLSLPLQFLAYQFERLSNGEIMQLSVSSKDHKILEVDRLSQASDQLVSHLKDVVVFTKSIGQGKVNGQLHAKSEADELTAALLSMQKELEEKRDVERIQSWMSNGKSQLSNTLQFATSLKEGLAESLRFILKEVVGVMGAIYFYDEEQDVILLSSAYAYNRVKKIDREFKPGIGLVGQCFKERQKIVMTEIPDHYAKITSAVGESKPKWLMIMPAKVNNEIYGIIEIAGLSEFTSEKIAFLEECSSLIGNFIRATKANETNQRLLQLSEKQAMQMKEQEEAMRQQIEELSATQEEYKRNEMEYLKTIERLKQNIISQ
ncbi:MAG: GAF domain-containing protein [Cyclobacteriaceae bacterium]|nr:GAF domain-containing protein [Cyclobacteriaceae bacterium]MCH8517232.1 GAF domain-containing protein [Cyclobacteriaceae bacterium]